MVSSNHFSGGHNEAIGVRYRDDIAGFCLFPALVGDRVAPQNGVESLAVATIANQLVNRPDMIGQLGRHSWRARKRRMHMVEVVDAASPEQGRFQALSRPR